MPSINRGSQNLCRFDAWRTMYRGECVLELDECNLSVQKTGLRISLTDEYNMDDWITVHATQGSF